MSLPDMYLVGFFLIITKLPVVVLVISANKNVQM